jgi:hypothetical protein
LLLQQTPSAEQAPETHSPSEVQDVPFPLVGATSLPVWSAAVPSPEDPKSLGAS